jgi:MFS family permease
MNLAHIDWSEWFRAHYGLTPEEQGRVATSLAFAGAAPRLYICSYAPDAPHLPPHIGAWCTAHPALPPLAGPVAPPLAVLMAAAATSPAMAYTGFIIMGLGSSVIAPTAFSMVGQMAHPAARARAVARATLLGYFGYFFGPPFVGFLAGHFGLRAAFVFAAVLLASVPIWAHVLRRQR